MSILVEYQNFTPTTALYPKEFEEEYLLCGLASEVGELLGAFKKAMRDDWTDEKLSKEVLAESGDILWYLSQLLNSFNYSFEDVLEYNMRKLKDRQWRDVLQGSGDNR